MNNTGLQKPLILIFKKKSGEVFFDQTVGQGQSQGKFFLVGRSDGDYLVGRSAGGRRTDGRKFLLRFRTAQS